MKILLVNVDSIIPNLALQKIKIHHELLGDVVNQIKDEHPNTFPLLLQNYDKVYVSCVFDWNKHFCTKWEGVAEIGGSGYSLKKELPPEIDAIKPKINFGFTTRGCIRNCYFCIVPQKEGKIKIVGDIYDIWDGKSDRVILMDNNILAAPKHFSKICDQLRKENLIVDFNQGLDCRLLTDKLCRDILSLKFVSSMGLRFAFDDIKSKKSVLKALKLLKDNGMPDWFTRWYVYVGVKDTVDTVMERIKILKENKQFVFLMRDKKVRDNTIYREIYEWSCHPGLYKKTDYYIGVKKNAKAKHDDKLNKNRKKLF